MPKKGESMSEETKNAISKTRKRLFFEGKLTTNPNWINTKPNRTSFKKGHVFSKATIEKMSNTRKNNPELYKHLQRYKGENSGRWKEDAGYVSIHLWVRKRKLKPEFCEKCHKVPPYDLANISGKYTRKSEDYQWLCRKCHLILDGTMNNLKLRWKK